MMNPELQGPRTAVRASPRSRASKTPTDGSRWAFIPRNRARRSPESPRTAVRGSLRTFVFILAAAALCSAADGLDEFRIKREGPFEFERRPVVTRAGDRVTVAFETKTFCDVTVAIENEEGRIVRHLASGILGPNAPQPFRKNAKRQSLVWDGKNDQGRYIDDKDKISVRVSLGLRPRFERTLFWHPKKRPANRRNPRAVAQPEGVYVYEGGGIESIRLYGHDGEYVRTVYPFPADKVKQVKGLDWGTFPDGYTAPKHRGFYRETYLSGGTGRVDANWATSAESFAVHRGRIALVPWARAKGSDNRLTRLRTDGTTGDVTLFGGPITTPMPAQSAAFSPDGQWLYLTGLYKNTASEYAHVPAVVKWRHAVYRLAYASEEPPALWLGGNEPGNGEREFNHPSSVCVDAKGRVYIADNHNDRVQIFSPEGRLLKSLPVKGPAVLQIHHKTQDLYVFCWTMAMGHGAYYGKPYKAPAALRVFAPFESAEPKQQMPLPLANYRGHTSGLVSTRNQYWDECPFRATLDSYTDPPTVWMVNGYTGDRHYSNWRAENIQRYRIEDRSLALIETWNEQVVKAIARWQPAYRQRLHVDPRNGLLYVMEGKTNHQLICIDPESGRVKVIELPYTAEDMAIGIDGHVYLRCDRIIGRYRLDGFQEVPFDYGRECLAKWSSMARKAGRLKSAIVMPGNRPVYWHESGMGVNPNGEIVVSVCNSKPAPARRHTYDKPFNLAGIQQYTPVVYPGRFRYAEIHVWDKHGRLVQQDVVKGVMDGHGTLVDPKGDVYFLAGGHRVYGGKTDFWPLTGCVIKFKRGHGRFLCAGGLSGGVPVPLSKGEQPTVPPQLSCGTKGRFWVEDEEWIYPGVGFVHPGAPCQCWNSRFAVDLFGRVFAPETVRNQVAILDTNGSLIAHVGTYGSVDDGVPLDKDGGPARPRSIGGDEVSLVYACYVATHTDRRLFIADVGNSRIVSVKLGYHATERVALKDVANDES